MMKKIIFLFTMLFVFAFSWQGMAQFGCGSGVVITDGYTVSGITTSGTGGAEDWNDPNPANMSDGVNGSYFNDDVYMFTYTAGSYTEEITMTTFTRNSWNGLAIFETCTGTALDDSLNAMRTTSADVSLTVTATIAAGQTVYIATGQWGTPNDLDFDVTSFSVTEISCPAPTNLAVNSMTAPSNANFSWDAVTGAEGYNFEIQPQGTAQGTAGAVASGSGANTNFNATALVVGSDYTLYVQTDCGGGDTSTYSSLDFTFQLPPVNDDMSGATPITPSPQGTGCDPLFQAWFGGSGTTDSGMDGTCNTTSTGLDVFYSWTATSNYLVWNDGDGGPGIVIRDAAGVEITCQGTLASADIVLSGWNVGDDLIIQIYDYGTADVDVSFCIEELVCPAPSALTNSNISTVFADFDWTENGSAGTWNVEVKAGADFTPGNIEYDHTTNTTVHPFGFGYDLIPNTTYYWYVRADCGGGDASEWVGPESFTTLSNAEPDWYNMQWLSDGTNGSNTSLTVDAWTTITGYAQVHEPGVTDAAGQGAGVECWIGGHNENTDPSTWDDSNWEVATYNGDVGDNDEYKLDKEMDFTGTVYVAARWRLEGNGPFVYGAYNGPWDGTTNNSIELIVNPVVDNDDCSGAELLTVEGEIADLASATQVGGTIASATDSGVTAQTGTANDDIWYSFVATASTINIDVTDDFDGVIELFSGSCGSLTSIEYDDNDGPSYNPSISRTDFNIGETYYIRVYYYWGSATSSPDFTIALWTSDVLGIANQTISGFNMFPNPVLNTLNLNAQNKIDAVSVYNMLGQEVLRNRPSATQVQLDMSSLPTGSYIVKVQAGAQLGSYNLIKQ